MQAANDILVAHEIVGDLREVRRALRDQVHEVAERCSAEAEHVVRLVVPVQRVSACAWLDAQELFPRVYWEGRDDGLEVAAAGAADVCSGGSASPFTSLRAQLDRVLPQSDDQVRYFGGFRFDPVTGPDPEWTSFATFHFVLPRFELDLRPDDVLLVCNMLLPRDAHRLDELEAEIEALAWPQEQLEGALPTPSGRQDAPDHPRWRAMVEDGLRDISSGVLDKIVLARRSSFTFEERLDVVLLLEQLRAATPGCFHFLFQPIPESAFLGASPERLFRRDGRSVWTEAVAGTRPRGATVAQDRRYRDALLGSDKELREHEFVRRSIAADLKPLTSALEMDEKPAPLQLEGGWHLASRVEGRLKDGVHGSEVMEALHPTPAVGGQPLATAYERIRAWEPFDRGWYAGPVGWIGTHGAEFAVAIRSGLATNRTLSLYSGAGIVEGSDPESEWDEIEQKIGDFTRLFRAPAHTFANGRGRPLTERSV